MSDQLHKGHRERMRLRFYQKGAEGFADHELLELLLYYAVPRGDVNPLAHRILQEFGSLSMLFSSDAVEIARRCGIKESTALLICLQSAFANRVQQEKWRMRPKLDSVSALGQYAVDLLSQYQHERFYMVCLDSRKILIHTCLISEGTINESVVYPRLVVEQALKYKAVAVAFLHNHPGGTLVPSLQDIEMTVRMAKILREIGISVMDHIIVADQEYCSFVQRKLLPIQKE